MGTPSQSSLSSLASIDTFTKENTLLDENHQCQIEALAHPPAKKRRRAKRTEEERIDYLTADPYVAQFEAYRVLCASCDKWIRLRPNSTYCSIPWDAHRKSCLAKKVNSKNIYALEERNALFSKDPDARKFDAERVLCSICDKWLSVNPDDHLQAVQKWLQHRAACQRNTTAPLPDSRTSLTESASTSAPPPTEQQASGSGPPCHCAIHHSTSPISPKPGPGVSQNNHHTRHHSTDPSFHDLNPSNFAPTHESRRRNAEQRRAVLAESLICEHRGKCLARHQRRVHKVSEVADSRSRKHGTPDEEDEWMSENDTGTDGPESEEVIDSHAEGDRFRRRDITRELQRGNGKARMRSAYQYPGQTRHSLGGASVYQHEHPGGAGSYSSRTRTQNTIDPVGIHAKFVQQLESNAKHTNQDDADAEVETNMGEKNYGDGSSADRTQLVVEDDLANELIRKVITGHNPDVTFHINGSTFNDIHGNQNIHHGDQYVNIHNYGDLSGNHSSNDIDPKGNHHMKIIERAAILATANVRKVFRVIWSRRYSFFSGLQPLTCESFTSTTYWHLHL